MTIEDKATEYDKLTDYLRKQGWEVIREVTSPESSRVIQLWDHPDNAARGQHSVYDWITAFRMECYADAPKQGSRMAETLRALSDRPAIGEIGERCCDSPNDGHLVGCQKWMLR